MDFSGIVAMARDIAFITLLLVGTLLVLLLYRKVSALSVSARRARESVEEIMLTFSSGFVRPQGRRSAVMSGLGKGTSWLRRCLRRRRNGGSEEEERE